MTRDVFASRLNNWRKNTKVSSVYNLILQPLIYIFGDFFIFLKGWSFSVTEVNHGRFAANSPPPLQGPNKDILGKQRVGLHH